MINWLEKTINNIVTYWKNKQYWKSVLIVFSIITTLIVMVLVGYFLIGFIIVNFDALVFIISAYVFLYFIIREHYAEKRSAREKAQQEQQAMQEEIDKKALEANYQIVRKIVYSALKNTADLLGLKQPLNEQDLDSPSHVISQGRFYLYQYVIFKKTTMVENDILKSVLQDEINRLLSNGHVSGLGNQTFYMFEGIMRNYIDLYQLTDNTSYVTLSVAIASEEYYKFKSAQYSSSLLIHNNTGSQRDKDF